MANEMMFTIDAKQILAKLHFAALQATRGSTGRGKFFVNTGIANDDPNGKPEKIGKTVFKLDNPSGSYYAGYVTDLTYQKSFKLENAITDIFKLRSELYGEDRALLDKDDTERSEKEKRFKECGQMINDALSTAGKPTYSDADFQNEKTLVQIRDIIKNVLSTNEKVIEEISKYNESLKEKKEEVMPLLEQYMNVFAGADNVKNWDEKNVTAVQVSSQLKDPNDTNLVKNFEIQPISEKEREVLNSNFKSKGVKSKDGVISCTVKMCFYVEYKLSVNE